MRSPFTAVSPSRQQWKGVNSGLGPVFAPKNAAEMHESIDRARGYALLWPLIDDEILKQDNRFEKDRPKPPTRVTDYGEVCIAKAAKITASLAAP